MAPNRQKTSNQIKEPTPGHITAKLLKIKDKEKNLKSNQKKKKNTEKYSQWSNDNDTDSQQKRQK